MWPLYGVFWSSFIFYPSLAVIDGEHLKDSPGNYLLQLFRASFEFEADLVLETAFNLKHPQRPWILFEIEN